MKKLFVLTLATIMMLSLALAAFADDPPVTTQSTEVSYEVSDNYYVVTIPSTLNLNTTSTLDVTVSELHYDGLLQVTISGSNPSSDAPFRMKGQSNANAFIRYYIKNGNDFYTAGSTLYMTKAGLSLTFMTESSDLNFALKDKYTDNLTFTIS